MSGHYNNMSMYKRVPLSFGNVERRKNVINEINPTVLF